jgi:hypothetical protein
VLLKLRSIPEACIQIYLLVSMLAQLSAPSFPSGSVTALISIEHEERTYQGWRGSEYCLPSDEEERKRSGI